MAKILESNTTNMLTDRNAQLSFIEERLKSADYNSKRLDELIENDNLNNKDFALVNVLQNTNLLKPINSLNTINYIHHYLHSGFSTGYHALFLSTSGSIDSLIKNFDIIPKIMKKYDLNFDYRDFLSSPVYNSSSFSSSGALSTKLFSSFDEKNNYSFLSLNFPKVHTHENVFEIKNPYIKTDEENKLSPASSLETYLSSNISSKDIILTGFIASIKSAQALFEILNIFQSQRLFQPIIPLEHSFSSSNCNNDVFKSIGEKYFNSLSLETDEDMHFLMNDCLNELQEIFNDKDFTNNNISPELIEKSEAFSDKFDSAMKKLAYLTCLFVENIKATIEKNSTLQQDASNFISCLSFNKHDIFPTEDTLRIMYRTHEYVTLFMSRGAVVYYNLTLGLPIANTDKLIDKRIPL